jgi:hypothetical protein
MNVTDDFPVTHQNQVKRLPKRAAYDRATIFAILDEALICQVAFVQDGQPVVIPVLHARDGERILLHGSLSSRLLNHLAAGGQVCLTTTLLDGIVLARSVFHHSVNYRSAIVFGHGQAIENPVEKMAALQIFTERLIRGRWGDARIPNERELAATAVAAVTIESASAKVRTGSAMDDEADLELPVWAGVLPLSLAAGTPVPQPNLPAGIGIPDYIRDYQPATRA